MAILQIPIAKAGKGVTFSVDSDDLNAVLDSLPDVERQALIRDAFERALKDVLNTRMSKDIEAPSKLSGEAFEANKAKALAQAEKNFEDWKSGKLLKKSKAKSAEKREVLTEARRAAKEVVKNTLRAAGEKISHYAPKDITEWANKLVEDDPTYIEQAKITLEERAKVKPTLALAIKPDAKKVAKAEAEKAERKTQLSAKQAGMPKAKVPPRKGQAPSHSHTAH